jgi:hypothetical protein
MKSNSHPVLSKSNGFVCLRCGSDKMGYVCNECSQMICSCGGMGECPQGQMQREEEEERDKMEARREQLHRDIDNGYYD